MPDELRDPTDHARSRRDARDVDARQARAALGLCRADEVDAVPRRRPRARRHRDGARDPDGGQVCPRHPRHRHQPGRAGRGPRRPPHRRIDHRSGPGHPARHARRAGHPRNPDRHGPAPALRQDLGCRGPRRPGRWLLGSARTPSSSARRRRPRWCTASMRSSASSARSSSWPFSTSRCSWSPWSSWSWWRSPPWPSCPRSRRRRRRPRQRSGHWAGASRVSFGRSARSRRVGRRVGRPTGSVRLRLPRPTRPSGRSSLRTTPGPSLVPESTWPSSSCSASVAGAWRPGRSRSAHSLRSCSICSSSCGP